jgi:hypothetical protein
LFLIRRISTKSRPGPVLMATWTDIRSALTAAHSLHMLRNCGQHQPFVALSFTVPGHRDNKSLNSSGGVILFTNDIGLFLGVSREGASLTVATLSLQ